MKRNAQTAASVPFIMDERGSVRSGSSQLQRAALNSGRRLHELEIDLSAGDGIATVFLIPSNIEPFFWLVIFCVCAYVIARRVPNKHFVNWVFGLNKVWITSAHILLFDQVRRASRARGSDDEIDATARLTQGDYGPDGLLSSRRRAGVCVHSKPAS